jgi:uncharacterized membrane protein YhhN
MSFTLLTVALILALLDWIAVAKKWKPLEYFAKPGVMIILLVWLWSVSGFGGPLTWFALGLIFSLVGDVFLMLPREQFIAGLIAFLLAHIAYTIGLTASVPPLTLISLIMAIVVGITSTRIYRGVSSALVSSNNSNLKIPVRMYTIIISVMLLAALMTLVRPEWSTGSSLLVSTGAVLFYLSDAFLAWNKFVEPIRRGSLIVIITYHLGQMLIIVGAATHYL